MCKRSSSAIEEKKESKPGGHSSADTSPPQSCPLSVQVKKHNSESVKHKKPAVVGPKYKHPKSSKNSGSMSKDSFKEDSDIIPKGLLILEKSGEEEYYSRLGLSKLLKLPLKECQNYFKAHDVEIFKCKKIKAIQGKQQKEQDEKLVSHLFPHPYDIYFVITEKAVFTTLDVKKEPNKHSWMYVESRYTLYDLVKITSRKNSG